MDAFENLRTEFGQNQDKYKYYVIGLTVTSIGFAVYQTTGKALSIFQIPLGIAVILWGLSVYCGLMFMKYKISTMFANLSYLDTKRGLNPEIGRDPIGIERTSKAIKTAMNINTKRARKFGKIQDYTFLIGIICFIIWHILEMYSITVKG